MHAASPPPACSCLPCSRLPCRRPAREFTHWIYTDSTLWIQVFPHDLPSPPAEALHCPALRLPPACARPALAKYEAHFPLQGNSPCREIPLQGKFVRHISLSREFPSWGIPLQGKCASHVNHGPCAKELPIVYTQNSWENSFQHLNFKFYILPDSRSSRQVRICTTID